MSQNSGFSYVIEALREGFSFSRKGWNGAHVIALQVPDVNSKMSQPYIYITTDGSNEKPSVVVPWVASHSDLLADDWYKV